MLISVLYNDYTRVPSQGWEVQKTAKTASFCAYPVLGLCVCDCMSTLFYMLVSAFHWSWCCVDFSPSDGVLGMSLSLQNLLLLPLCVCWSSISITSPVLKEDLKIPIYFSFFVAIWCVFSGSLEEAVASWLGHMSSIAFRDASSFWMISLPVSDISTHVLECPY